MSTIHQIYCTHCTHGTSALSAAEGELAGRMLGYSARAGSLEARDLRRYYRQIERYVYYYLPRDTPSEEKLRLTASTAPRRLVFYPSAGGLQVIGQICYRQTDTEGRPGSYFAHVLFRDEHDGGRPWSQLDCLKLWAAPGWVEEDSTYHPFLLQPLASLEQMLAGHRPAIDDHVFLSFLSTPAGGSFDDPAGAIPDRWRRMDAAERSGLFTEAFRGFLEMGTTRRESLLLVIEPSVAALVFYGILRLLPDGEIRTPISFSTFEPNADRVGASLAATAFCDPLKADLRGDAYRSRGFALNTFTERRSESRRPQAPYATTMVRRLLERGWEAVDWSLASLTAAGARTCEDLDALAAVESLVPALFDPSRTRLDEGWRRSPMATNYLRQALVQALSGLGDAAASLEPMIGRPAHLTILELLAIEPEIPAMRGVVAFLLERLPGERIADFLKLGGVSSDAKVDVLVRHVTSHKQLPPGCDHLWNESPGRWPGSSASEPPEVSDRRSHPVPPPPPTRPAGPLLPSVLARLDLDTLEAFYAQVASRHSGAFLTSLFFAWQNRQCARESLTRVVGAVDDQALLSLFRARGAAFFREYPEDEPALGAKLHEMVGALTKHPRQFSERLDVVLAGRHLLPDKDQDVVTAWSDCRRAILEVGRLQDQRSGVLRQRPVEELETPVRRMAEAARRAMPPDRMDDDLQGSQKQTCLRQIALGLLGGRALLPGGVWQHDALWQKIAWYFQHRAWPAAPLRKMRPKSRSLGPRWILLCATVAVAAIVLVIGVLSSMSRSRLDRAEGALTPAVDRPSSSQATREGDFSGERTPRAPDTTGQAAGEGDASETSHGERRATESAREPRESPGPAPAQRQATRLPVEPEAPRASAATQPSRSDDSRTSEGVRPALPEPAKTTPVAEKPLPPVARPEAGVSAPRQAPATGSTLPQAETWAAAAERFAREHGGAFFDQAPLVNGSLEIPADALPAAADGTSLFLGGGALHLDHAMYRFGEGFEATAPVSRHEVPQLAAALSLPSVYVELQSRPGGWAVVLGHLPQTLPPDAEAKKEEILDQVENNSRMIRSQLRTYNSRAATEQAKDEAFDKLVELTGVEIPRVPPKPIRGSREYRDDPEAYKIVLDAYDEARAARDDARERVIPTAKKAVATVEERKQYVEEQFRQYEEQLRENNEKALAAIRDQCRGISVIVYRAGEGMGAARSSAADPAGTPTPGETTPGAGAVESMEGRFVVEEKPAQGLAPPAIAQIRPIVTGEGGRPLPAWYEGAIRSACEVVAFNADGLILRTTRLRDVFTEKSVDVFEKTTAARVTFRFLARRDGTSSQSPETPIAAAAHRIEPIDEGKQYTVNLQLPKGTLDWLRLLAAEPGSSQP